MHCVILYLIVLNRENNYDNWFIMLLIIYNSDRGGRRGRDRSIVLGFHLLCNQCLSSLMLWVRISIKARCTTLCDKVCQWLATGRWFYPGHPISSTNKTDRHDETETLLKVALNYTKQTNQQTILTKRLSYNNSFFLRNKTYWWSLLATISN